MPRTFVLAALAVACLLLPATALAQVAQYTADPTNFTSVSEAARKAGVAAEITCAPGTYPAFVRGNVNTTNYAFAKFLAPVTFKCAGATFPGAAVNGAENITVEGANFTGRLVFANCANVRASRLTFTAAGSTGVMARQCKNVEVSNNLITGSAAPLAFIDVTGLYVHDNVLLDYSGNAGIAAYGGGDIRIIRNTVTGSRPPPEGVHPDGIQTAKYQTGKVTISFNFVRYVGQGVFGGGEPDDFEAIGNQVVVNYPNALVWKSRNPARIGHNVLITLPSQLIWTPRFFNYGAGQTVPLAEGIDLGGNSVNGLPVVTK